MYSARTLLVPVLLMGGLMEVASAQHKYIFPQFAFGGGWESTLMVQALGSNTTCTFSAQDRSFTMRDPYGNNLSGTQLPVVLGMNEGTILKTATPQGMAASSGMAVLDCDEEVSANTLFSLEVGGSLVAEALVESSEEIVSGEPVAQFLADHRDGARFAVAVANPSNQPLDVLIAVGDLGGQQIGEVTVNVPVNAAQAFFVDEHVTIPTGHTGQVLIRPSNNPGPSVYVVGLRVTGLVITTIPAIVYPRPTTSPTNDLFSNARTISGPSGRVTGSNVGATDETGEPGFGSSSVWWQWQATSSGRVTIDTIGSSFDTTLGVYTGTRVDTLTTLGENDDAVGAQSRVTLTVTAGTVYRLRVAGFFGDEGSIVLNWNLGTEDPWSRTNIERFRGTWRFTYTKNSAAITNTFVLNIIVENDEAPGEWGIGGIQADGERALLFYSHDSDSYVLSKVAEYEDEDDIERLYSFNLTGPTTVSGCYFERLSSTSFSSCYPMTGARTSSTAPN